MDSSIDHAEDEENEISSSPSGSESPVMDRNPSPPPNAAGGPEDEDADAIGDTVYSKHWLFSTLTRLIHMVSEHSEEDADGQMQLSDEDEEDLCKVWDMAMDKDVAGFLQEFKATDILLGVIAKSRCPRLTEISVGILGNIACFPETCGTLSQNEDLSAVLLLLLGDTDPPTILETSRLLLTCVSQNDVCSLWLQRIRQQISVRTNLCFVMSSSTNTDLLEKVGELIDKLFDLDEELMKTWITAQPSEKEEDGDDHQDVMSCLLEAAKQLRSENPNGLEVYLHIFQLLTTIDEGLQIFAAPGGPGEPLWDFVCAVVCEDLCKASNLPVVLHEQKSVLVQAFAVLLALYRCQDQRCGTGDSALPLIGTVLHVNQFCKDDSTKKEETKDEQLQTLSEITAEFLADLCLHLSEVMLSFRVVFLYITFILFLNVIFPVLRSLLVLIPAYRTSSCCCWSETAKRDSVDTAAGLIKKGSLTEKTCLTAAASLLPEFKTSFQQLQAVLSEADPKLADVLRTRFPV